MPEGSDNPNISIKFTPDGADEVIQKARSIKREVEGIADAAAKAAQPGGVGGKRPQAELSPERLAIAREMDAITKRFGEFREIKKLHLFTKEHAREEARLKKDYRRLEKDDLRQMDKETALAAKEKHRLDRDEARRAGEEESRRMSEQRTHVQWVTRALQAIGLGKYAPGGSVGSLVLGALGPAAAGGISGLSALAIGGLGAAAAIGVPLGFAAWGVNRTLGKNPAYGLGVEAAGYLNPFEAAEHTREAVRLAERWERFKTQTGLNIAKDVNDAAIFMKRLHAASAELMKTGSPEKSINAADEVAKSSDVPTVGEMRMRYEMSRPMMAGLAPASDMARMGIYARATEGEAMRSGRVWQQELIDALQRFSSSSEQRLRTAQAGGSTPAALAHMH